MGRPSLIALSPEVEAGASEGDDRRRERRARTLSSAVHIVEVAELDLAFEPRPWQFAQTHAEAVATRWARLRKEKPEVYNGRVLLMRRWALAPRINGGLKLEGDYFEVDYADFVAWRPIGDSIEPVFNCFAMAALRGADGAFLLGEMAPHTTNGGRSVSMLSTAADPISSAFLESDTGGSRANCRRPWCSARAGSRGCRDDL